jgi:hypothetical protein
VCQAKPYRGKNFERKSRVPLTDDSTCGKLLTFAKRTVTEKGPGQKFLKRKKFFEQTPQLMHLLYVAIEDFAVRLGLV